MEQAQLIWQHDTAIEHWIKHSVIPVLLIVLFLLLPKPWTLALFQPNNVIQLELIENQPITPVIPTTEPIKQPPVAPVIEQAIEQPQVSPIETASEKTPTIESTAKPPEPITIKPSKAVEVNAGDVLQMIQNRTSIDITPEFQARTQPATDFYIPEQEIHDWLADIPFLDESVDKPKLQMKFYAQGFTGGIEKFFDKITISKTFTTKYGTKIHCALIGVIAACGWK